MAQKQQYNTIRSNSFTPFQTMTPIYITPMGAKAGPKPILPLTEEYKSNPKAFTTNYCTTYSYKPLLLNTRTNPKLLQPTLLQYTWHFSWIQEQNPKLLQPSLVQHTITSHFSWIQAQIQSFYNQLLYNIHVTSLEYKNKPKAFTTKSCTTYNYKPLLGFINTT